MLTRNARILPLRADWSNGVLAEYGFKTEVFTSRDGTEQRTARRQVARQATEVASNLRRGAAARLEADMAKSMIEPVFTRAEWLQARTTAVAASGSSVLTFDAVPFWIVDGVKVIATTGTHEDLLTVSATTATTVTVEEAISTEYDVATVVHKALEARFPDTLSVTAITETIKQPRIRLEVIPGTEVETFSNTPLETFEGRELFLKKPNWRDTVSLDFAEPRDVLDPGLGRDFMAAYRRATQLTVQCGYTGMSFDKAHELVDFFMRQRGRRNAFWAPVWSRNIQPSETVVVGDNTFQVDGPDFAAAYDGNPLYRAMVAFWPDGGHQANRVTSVTGAADATVTTVDDWDNPIEESTRIFWLAYARLNSDVIGAQWLTTQNCEITLPITILYAPDPE